MTRAITFIPGATRTLPQDLHYFDAGARNRSVHALFQDSAGSRRPFLLKAYGELVARFGARGRIEHPLAFLRDLSRALEGLSRRADCRIDDFEGIGVYVLVRDGESFYLLASRGGNVLVDTGAGFAPLGESPARELPLDTARSQQELFSQTMRDTLALYRIDPPAGAVPGEAPDVVLRVVMGSTRDDARTVAASLDEPGALELTDASSTHAMIAQTVVAVTFPPARPARDPVLDALRAGQRPRPPRMRRVVAGLSAAIVVAVLATTWIATRNAPTPTPSPRVVETESEPAREAAGGAAQEASPRLRDEPAQASAQAREATLAMNNEPPEASIAPPVRMSIDWKRSYGKPVTTTPVIDGDRVIFGSRDGHVYALEGEDGEAVWNYAAGGGVGASPVLAGGAVIAADYSGRVVSLDRRSGSPLWTRDLPARVVGTPCPAGGEVLVGCTDGVAYGLSLETGRVLWKVNTRGKIRASSAAADDAFYVPSYDGKLYAVSQGSGAVRWAHPVGGPVKSSPAAGDGRVVVGAPRGIVAINAETGGSLWHFATRAPVDSYVALAAGRVLAGCGDGHVYCLEASTGRRLWAAPTGENVLSRPLVAGELVFVTSYDKNVYCFRLSNGERVDRLGTSGAIYSSPVAAGDRVFFGNNQGEFYCINYRTERPE